MASCVKTWCSLERRGMVLRFVRRSGGRTERTASVGTFIACRGQCRPLGLPLAASP
jgi:hypothetical protein